MIPFVNRYYHKKVHAYYSRLIRIPQDNKCANSDDLLTIL